MKVRLLKKWGTNYAGQVLTNVAKGAIPGDVGQEYDDDDPAVNTVVDQSLGSNPLRVDNDEIDPKAAAAYDERQRSTAKHSEAVSAQQQRDAAKQAEDAEKQSKDANERVAKLLQDRDRDRDRDQGRIEVTDSRV